jgi:phytanoyl-CoA hydroxylase
VILHGLVPHRSGANDSPRSRLAYALHVVDRAAVWSSDNWLRRPAGMPFRGFDE